VVTRQHHHQGFLDEETERQLRHPLFPSKESGIHGSLYKGIRELWRVLTRDHHVDVRQCIPQDLKRFWHPRRFVVRQKAHNEARLGRVSDPARSIGCRFHLRQHQTSVIKKRSTCSRQFDATSAARQEVGAYFFLKISYLPAQ